MISYNYVVDGATGPWDKLDVVHAMLEELSVIYFTVAIMCSDQCYTVKDTLCTDYALSLQTVYCAIYTGFIMQNIESW